MLPISKVENLILKHSQLEKELSKLKTLLISHEWNALLDLAIKSII